MAVSLLQISPELAVHIQYPEGLPAAMVQSGERIIHSVAGAFFEKGIRIQSAVIEASRDTVLSIRFTRQGQVAPERELDR